MKFAVKLILILHVKATTFEPQKLCVFTCSHVSLLHFKKSCTRDGVGEGVGVTVVKSI